MVRVRGADLSAVDLEALHDRMTEQCWSEESFEEWFGQASPKPVASVPLLGEGLAALQRRTVVWDWHYQKMSLVPSRRLSNLAARPTDVELMMLHRPSGAL